MKKLILTLSLICCIAGAGVAQNKGFTGLFSADVGSNYSKNNLYRPFDYVFAPGYSFNGRFFVRVPVTISNELFNVNELRDYETNLRLGITAGYDIAINQYNIMELTASFGGTAYSELHKSLYYDISARWAPNTKYKLLVGLGARYYQSQTALFKDYTTLYASVGFRFN